MGNHSSEEEHLLCVASSGWLEKDSHLKPWRTAAFQCQLYRPGWTSVLSGGLIIGGGSHALGGMPMEPMGAAPIAVTIALSPPTTPKGWAGCTRWCLALGRCSENFRGPLSITSGYPTKTRVMFKSRWRLQNTLEGPGAIAGGSAGSW